VTRYEQIAEAAGVHLCDPDECKAYHGQRLVIHFGRQRFTYAGAFSLMKKAHAAIHGRPLLRQPWYEPWYEQWQQVLWIMRLARDTHVRLPKSTWEMDRARLREAISRHRAKGLKGKHEEWLDAAERWAWRK
jgi:curved DNA-binding protein CbpA